MKTEYLIIGAGPTGLGAAYRLKELGISDYLLVDQNGWAGGLATSFQDENGFVWDIGGHVQFSHYPYFDAAMDAALPADQWLVHERESWVWIKDRFVPYPFQNNLRYLPRDALWTCLKGIVALHTSPKNAVPANFHEWIVATFGSGVADEFMLPYNFKVWAHYPRDMSFNWIGERVAVTNLERVLENVIYEKLDASWGPNNVFKFPKFGGTGAIWLSIANIVGNDRIRLASKVASINPERKAVTLADGAVLEYENLLSTMPLDQLAKLTVGVPDRLVARAGQLKHSSSNIIGVGVKGKPLESIGKKCWMYFPEDNCPFYRVTVFSNYSPNNVPDIEQYYSLMCEVSESPDKPVDHARMIEDTVQGLVAAKQIPADAEIASTWYYRAEYGYPTPSLDRDAILSEVLPHLDALGVYSRGRFGAWMYEVSNQDHTFMQGVEWVNSQVLGEPETTFDLKPPKDKPEEKGVEPDFEVDGLSIEVTTEEHVVNGTRG